MAEKVAQNGQESQSYLGQKLNAARLKLKPMS